jgi:hypothetical protein
LFSDDRSSLTSSLLFPTKINQTFTSQVSYEDYDEERTNMLIADHIASNDEIAFEK